MRKLHRRRDERVAFLVGEIFATAIAVKEISCHGFPVLSLVLAFPSWSLRTLAGLTPAQSLRFHLSLGISLA
jgi:hypothetical protein